MTVTKAEKRNHILLYWVTSGVTLVSVIVTFFCLKPGYCKALNLKLPYGKVIGNFHLTMRGTVSYWP